MNNCITCFTPITETQPCVEIKKKHNRPCDYMHSNYQDCSANLRHVDLEYTRSHPHWRHTKHNTYTGNWEGYK